MSETLADKLDAHAIRYANDYGYNVATDLKEAAAELRAALAADQLYDALKQIVDWVEEDTTEAKQFVLTEARAALKGFKIVAPPASPLRGRDRDLIALDAAHQIEALPSDLHKAQKTARIQLIVLDALSASPPEQPAVQLQARKIGQDEWIDIYPAQVEAMSKAGHNLRAIEQVATGCGDPNCKDPNCDREAPSDT